jgi:hypothetical protein
MTRRTLNSDLSRASERPTEPAPASGVGTAGSDFGLWLTRDLRPKGAPSEIPVERPSQAPSVMIADAAEPELASWLLQDLKPRHSQLPEAQQALLAPPSSAQRALSLPSPDSLMPHAVSDVPSAPLPVAAPLTPALDDEDLAVLPSRPGKGLRARWRHAVVLAALLAVGGALFWVGTAPQAEQVGGGTNVAAAPMAAAPLPPPPPPEGAELELAAPVEAVPAPAARGPASTADEDPELDERGARGRRAGDAVARFADLPGATLSRLARDERQKARARSSKPAKAPAPAPAP